MKKRLQRLLSIVLVAVMACSVQFVKQPSLTKAEDLPFVIESTDYGVSDSRVVAKKIRITDKDSRFITCDDEEDDGLVEDYCHGNAVVTIKQKINNDKANYYLVGKDGLIKKFSNCDKHPKIYALGTEGIEYYAKQGEYSYDRRNDLYDDALYQVYNGDNHKTDIYNATKNKYYDYECDGIRLTPKYGLDSNLFGGFEIIKNEKRGLLNPDGTILYEPVFDDISYYDNCCVGIKKSDSDWKYVLLSYDGKSDIKKEYDGIRGGDDVVCGVEKANEDNSNDYAIISIDGLAPITDFIYDEHINVVKDKDNYCVIAHYHKKYSDDKYGYVYDVFYNDKKWSVNELFGGYSSNVDVNFANPKFDFYDTLRVRVYRDTNPLLHIDPVLSGTLEQSASAYWISRDGEKIYRELGDYTTNESLKEYDKTKGYFNNLCIEYDNSKDTYIIKNSSDGIICEGFSSLEKANDLVIARYKDSGEYAILDSKTCRVLLNNVYLMSHYKNVDNYYPALHKAIVIFDTEKTSDSKFGLLNSETKEFSGFIFKTPKLDGDGLDTIQIEKEWSSKKGYVWDIRFKLESEGDNLNEQDVVINDKFQIVANEAPIFCDEELNTFYLNEGKNIVGCSYSGEQLFKEESPSYLDEQAYMIPREGYIIADKDKEDEYNDDEKVGLISKDGGTILDTDYDEIGITHYGMTYAENNEEDDNYDYINMSYVFDLKGNPIIEGQFNHHHLNKYSNTHKYHIYRMGEDTIISLGHDNCVYLYDYSECIGKERERDYSNVRNQSFNSSNVLFSSSKNEGYYYSDSYFNNNATVYQQSLATMSLCMAFSTYGSGNYEGYDSNVKRIMTQCGFAQKGAYEQYHFNEKPSSDSIGCAIGSKEVNGSTVIAVAVRSGGYEAEWISNVSLGKLGDHDGFDNSSDKVKDYINSYIIEKGIKGNVKIWITGYSRGGAVATQTAAKLNDLAGYGYEKNGETNRVEFDKKSIYAYGFATPAGVLGNKNIHSSQYYNIFNIIDYHDPVPLVAPGKWKFDRYGITKILPYNKTKYANRLKNKMGEEYSIDSFGTEISSVTNSLGTFNRKLINSVVSIMGQRSDYVNTYQGEMVKMFEISNEVNDYSFGDFVYSVTRLLPRFVSSHPLLWNELSNNITLLADVHANPRYYVYQMQMMDKNYYPNSFDEEWADKNYRVFKANCPVDVYVYDSQEKEIARIENNQFNTNDENGVNVCIDENGQKVVYVPVGEKYNIKVVAQESCDVSCGFEEYNTEFGDTSRVVNFKTTRLEEGEELRSSVDAFSSSEIENGAAKGSDVEYELTYNDESVDIQSDIKGPENIENHTYEVKIEYDEDKGTVYGGGSFVEGSFAKLQAENKPGYDFEGFYIDDKKIENTGSEYDKYSVRIQVNSNTVVEARFTECNHEWDSGKVTKEPTYTSTGIKTYTCEICGKTKTTTIAKLKRPAQQKQSTYTKKKKKTKKSKLKVKVKNKKVKVSKLWRKKVVLKKALKAKCGSHKVHFYKDGGSKRLKVNKKGHIIVKKGTPVGKYKIKVFIDAYNGSSYVYKVVTVKVRVKY